MGYNWAARARQVQWYLFARLLSGEVLSLNSDGFTRDEKRILLF